MRLWIFFGASGGSATPLQPPVTLTGFNHPHGIWQGIDSSTFLVADTLNFVVREVNPSSSYSVSVYAGQEGVEGYSGDNGTATAATLWSPYTGVTSGNYTYIVDLHSCMIRAVDSSGIITKFFGEHRVCQSDATHLNHPRGITTDNFYLFVSEMWGNDIRQITISDMSRVYLIGSTVEGKAVRTVFAPASNSTKYCLVPKTSSWLVLRLSEGHFIYGRSTLPTNYCYSTLMVFSISFVAFLLLTLLLPLPLSSFLSSLNFHEHNS